MLKTVRLFYRAVLLLLPALFFILPPQAGAVPQPGRALPEFRLSTTAGQTVTAESSRGRVLVLDFFASWCIPCRTSVPHLVELNSKYGRQGLQMLGISADENEKGLMAFAEWHRINYPIAMAAESTYRDFGIRSLPVLLLVDRNGLIDRVYHGFTADIARQLESRIKQLLVQ